MKNYITLTIGLSGRDEVKGMKEACEITDQTGVPVLLENTLGDPIAMVTYDRVTYYN